LLNIDLKKTESKEYEFKEATLEIRPYPASMSTTIIRQSEDGATEMVIPGVDKKKAFMYALMSAKNLGDINDKDLVLTDEIKGKIFDFDHILETGIPKFVLAKSGALQKAEEAEGKN